MKAYSPIIRSLITEKSSNQQASGQYTFEITQDATKTDVKKAIKALYGVEANKVKIILTTPKSRLIARGRMWTKRPSIKKALVTLKSKKTIDPNKIKEKK